MINSKISEQLQPEENILERNNAGMNVELSVENTTVHVTQYEPFNISVVITGLADNSDVEVGNVCQWNVKFISDNVSFSSC